MVEVISINNSGHFALSSSYTNTDKKNESIGTGNTQRAEDLYNEKRTNEAYEIVRTSGDGYPPRVETGFVYDENGKMVFVVKDGKTNRVITQNPSKSEVAARMIAYQKTAHENQKVEDVPHTKTAAAA